MAETLISVGYLALLSYLSYFYLIPRLLIRKRTGWFIAAFACSFALLTLLRYDVEGIVFGFSKPGTNNAMSTQLIVQGMISDLFIVLFVGLLRFASDWLELNDQRQELEREKLNAELKFLKAQVNPHFLFNTLNNLYYLATIRSEAAPLVISKLSEVMRYMIYDSNQEKVELGKEIEYMRDYISLERLRLNDGVQLEFDVDGNTDMLISPLILITFLENAFKHGSGNGNAPGWIRARLEVGQERLMYRIGNSKPAKEMTGGHAANEGIGLANVRRRLELSYPGKYRLGIDDREDAYYVHLTIERL